MTALRRLNSTRRVIIDAVKSCQFSAAYAAPFSGAAKLPRGGHGRKTTQMGQFHR
jgi:hypothetical protein